LICDLIKTPFPYFSLSVSCAHWCRDRSQRVLRLDRKSAAATGGANCGSDVCWQTVSDTIGWWRGVVGNAFGWNEVTLRRARLVLRWLTACGQVNHLGAKPAS